MSYFEDQLNADQSLQELHQLIDSIHGWMGKNKYHSQRTLERFDFIQSTLTDHQRNVLFLAEFSKGKSELINATIFGDQGMRLLPSAPGRTTRCTTVLEFQQSMLPGIRLLPTQSSPGINVQPIEMVADDNPAWVNTLFSLHDKKAVKQALLQVTEAEMVTPEKAAVLGFVHDTGALQDADLVDGMVPIPKWRHAIINYPHPLLKQGLRIIDTPGLNALGVEPELTIQAIDSAHAMIFVLSADTGITRSELAMWRDHVEQHSTDNIIVVLNKIDLLWDELKSRVEIDQDIKRQIKEVSRVLEVPIEQIFPVSAQKAMVGRAKDDQRLVKSSGIQQYEQALADTINYTNQRRIVTRAIDDLSPTLNAIRSVVKRRIEETTTHVTELQNIHDNQQHAAQTSLEKIKRDVAKYNSALKKIVDLKGELTEGYSQFVRRLDLLFLDRMIASYRYEISNQLTTPGLQREMNDFYAVAVDRFQMALSYVIRLQKKITVTFAEVEEILGLKDLTARKIDPHMYIESLKKFQSSHFKHSTGLAMIMTEQHVLRDRYHGSVMLKVRNLYKETRDDVDRWCRTVLVPLELEIKDHTTDIKRRHSSLERVYKKDFQIQDEINDLLERETHNRHRLATMDHFIRRLAECSERNNRYPGNVIAMHQPAIGRSTG